MKLGTSTELIAPRILQFVDKGGNVYQVAIKDLELVAAAIEFASEDQLRELKSKLSDVTADVENKLAKLWFSKQKPCK